MPGYLLGFLALEAGLPLGFNGFTRAARCGGLAMDAGILIPCRSSFSTTASRMNWERLVKPAFLMPVFNRRMN